MNSCELEEEADLILRHDRLAQPRQLYGASILSPSQLRYRIRKEVYGSIDFDVAPPPHGCFSRKYRRLPVLWRNQYEDMDDWEEKLR